MMKSAWSSPVQSLRTVRSAVQILLTRGMPSRLKRRFLFRGLVFVQRRDLAHLELLSKGFTKYIQEFRSDSEFQRGLSERLQRAKEVNPRFGGSPISPTLEFIYALVRYSQPEVLVETGVGAGGTSLCILKALQANGKGHLYSIDLPGADEVLFPDVFANVHVPKGYEPGWLVPSELKGRWTLTLGDAKLQLPILLAKLERIDFFFHDSLHTYDHMMFEYCLAYAYLGDGAWILSHDVTPSWSLAFMDFCDAMHLDFALVNAELGVAPVARKG
jgi:hypothetical protein